MEARDILIEIYRDHVNNYITVEKFAEHNGLTVSEAERLLALAKEVTEHPHPES